MPTENAESQAEVARLVKELESAEAYEQKLRQIIGASLKAYREVANTRAWRERIIVDYLNTVPLAAAPGYGEIHGLGEALHAWFGMRLDDVVATLNSPGRTPAKVRAFKHVLTLLISVRAPSVFLIEERASLEEKVGQFTRLMARAGIIDGEFAAELQDTPIRFLPAAPLPPQPSSSKNKAGNAIRKYKVVKSDGPDDLVFQGVQSGGPLRDNNILVRFIKPAARSTELPWVNWRSLRTSHATWLKMAGPM